MATARLHRRFQMHSVKTPCKRFQSHPTRVSDGALICFKASARPCHGPTCPCQLPDPCSQHHPPIMQRVATSRQAQALYQKISASTLSCTTVYVREANMTYLAPQTPTDIDFGDALKAIDFHIAVKARSRYIHALLEHLYVDCHSNRADTDPMACFHSSPSVRFIHLRGSSTLAVIETAASLPTARGHTGAILVGQY